MASNKKIITAAIAAAFILTALFVNGSADGTTPGSEADPVVTQSYVELKSEQTKYYIDSLVEKNSQEIAALKTQLGQKDLEIAKLKETVDQLSAAGGFVVVPIKQGSTILVGNGTELVVRSGKTTAIAGKLGGLADVTVPNDLETGEAVPTNHLLISSRDDGRGLKIVTDSFLLIRGTYTIK